MCKSFLTSLLIALPLWATEHSGKLSVEPYVFRKESQLWLQTVQRLSNMALENPWSVSAHLEFETELERNRSFDIDRAWFRTALDDTGEWTWGRIHPWDISLHPSASKPWALDGSLQSQNRGTLLGEGLATDVNFPSPILTGWLGAHYWSDPSGNERFQWGFSISPVFFPTLGSTVDYGSSTRPGRFSRNDGPIETEQGKIPLRYELADESLQQTLIQPQVMGQAYIDLDTWVNGLENWFWVSQAPQPEPQRGSEPIQIRQTPNGPVAITKPNFPRRWAAGNTLVWTPYNLRGYSFFTTVTYQDNPRYGIEVGAKNPYIQISILNETKSFNNYTDQLVQYEGHYPLGRFTPFWGAKHHLRLKDAWFRTGVRATLAPATQLELGADVFAGSPTDTYFGQWQNNDRVYLVFVWNLEE